LTLQIANGIEENEDAGGRHKQLVYQDLLKDILESAGWHYPIHPVVDVVM